ncbi:MAG: hypothetical protein JW808_08975 [Victivallales bacterium]|nr:hypothetical protein [Victivallales bacterium]
MDAMQHRCGSGRACLVSPCRSGLALALLFLLAIHAASATPTSTCEFKFFSRKGKVNTEDVRTVFRSADIIVSRLVPRIEKGKPPPTRYSIVLMDSAEFKGIEIINLKGTEIRFHLPEDFNDWIGDDKALSSLIEGIMLKKLDLDPSLHSRKIPPWLILGILGKLRARLCTSSIPGIRTYPAVKMLVTDDPPPDLLKVVFSAPRDPDPDPMTSISIQTSDVLLSAVMRLAGHREAIKSLVDLSVQGVDHEQAFVRIFAGMVRNFLTSTSELTLLQEKLDDYGMLREWLYENAILLSINIFSPARAGFVERHFQKIDVVPYIMDLPEDRKVGNDAGSGGDADIRYCSLHELNEKRNEIKDFPSVVRNREQLLSRLEFTAPTILHEGIRLMRRSLFNLRSDSSYQFRKNFLAAKKTFFEHLQRCHDIEGFMDDTEVAVVPESWRFRSEMREIERHQVRKGTLWPEVSKVLDSMERK